MRREATKKLSLSRETLCELLKNEMEKAVGGVVATDTCFSYCHGKTC